MSIFAASILVMRESVLAICTRDVCASFEQCIESSALPLHRRAPACYSCMAIQLMTMTAKLHPMTCARNRFSNAAFACISRWTRVSAVCSRRRRWEGDTVDDATPSDWRGEVDD